MSKVFDNCYYIKRNFITSDIHPFPEDQSNQKHRALNFATTRASSLAVLVLGLGLSDNQVESHHDLFNIEPSVISSQLMFQCLKVYFSFPCFVRNNKLLSTFLFLTHLYFSFTVSSKTFASVKTIDRVTRKLNCFEFSLTYDENVMVKTY